LRMEKLFVAYSEQCIPSFEVMVRNAISDGFQILALDIRTANRVRKLGHQVSFLEDWLSIEERVCVWRLGIELEKLWFDEIYSQDPILNGFDARRDHIAMAGFWYEVALQHFLAESFLRKQIGILRIIRFQGYGAAFTQSESDTFGSLWENNIDKKICVQILRVTKPYSLKEILQKSPIRRLAKRIYAALSFTNRNTKIRAKTKFLFVLSKGELYYYEPIIRRILSLGLESGDVVIVLTNVNQAEASKISRQTGLRTMSGIAMNMLLKTAPPCFKRNEIFKIKNDLVRNAYFGNQSHFEYFETQRWPRLSETLEEYQFKILNMEVGVVIITNSEDQLSQLIGNAASVCKVPSVSLPHGILAFTQRGLSSTKYFAVGNELARMLAIESGVKAERVVKLQNLDPTHEYLMEHIVAPTTKFRILVLLDPIQGSNSTRVYAHPFIGYKEQIAALRAILPIVNNENCDVIIKTHPGWPELEVIEFADPHLVKYVCPSNTSLDHLVANVDLVISVNYAAAALVAVAKAALPTILFWKAPLLCEVPFGFANVHVFKEMGEFINCDEGLLRCVEAVRTSVPFRKHLEALSEGFRDKYLDTRSYETIEKFILEIGSSEVDTGSTSSGHSA
jgi:hypothetical protein